MSVLYIKDKETGQFISVPTIKGDKGKYFVPSLSNDGYLTFTSSEPNADGQYENITFPVSLKGEPGRPGDVPSDVVRCSEQNLSEDQQIQARKNIGAASEEDVSKTIEHVVNDFGGTVEVTSGLPQKEQTVLTVDPDGDEVNLYTAEEIDGMMEELTADVEEHLTAKATIHGHGTAGQFAVSDGNGGILWKTLYEAEEVSY